MSEIENFDLSTLPTGLRHSIHRTLYRQECRAWLLALGLLLNSYLLANIDALIPLASMKEPAKWYACIASAFLAFWVVYPSQRILAELRKEAKPEDGNLECKFDNSWQSVWDFIPPLLLPLALFLVPTLILLIRAI